jgi:hypothetical protein
MVGTDMLAKLINWVRGALIFLLLVAVAVAIYQIFWATVPTYAEQNFDTVLSELPDLEKGCFEVVTRSYAEDYDLFLYGSGNKVDKCGGRPCLCIKEIDKPMVCKVLDFVREDCDKGVCVEGLTKVHFSPYSSKPVKICNTDNRLTIG